MDSARRSVSEEVLGPETECDTSGEFGGIYGRICNFQSGSESLLFTVTDIFVRLCLSCFVIVWEISCKILKEFFSKRG